MNIIVIIIIIVVIILLTICLYPIAKYYYLRKYKPDEFLTYAHDKWLIPEINSLDGNLASLGSDIALLDNRANQSMQSAQMGYAAAQNLLNTGKPKMSVENTLYDSLENKSNNCINNLSNIRKYTIDINRIKPYVVNPISIIDSMISKAREIRNKFTNKTFGPMRALEDASKMQMEKQLKEESTSLLNDIYSLYSKLKEAVLVSK